MARYYTREMVGPVCRHCLLKVPLRSAEDTHPSCGPMAAAALRADAMRVREVEDGARRLALVDAVNEVAS
jgi:hypothetical protein